MALLNNIQIKTIFEIDKTGELYARLLDIFETDMPILILDLEAALNKGEVENAKKISHSIKSSSLNMGAAELANMASKLEVSVTVNKEQNAAQLIEFRECFEYSVAELKKNLNLCKS